MAHNIKRKDSKLKKCFKKNKGGSMNEGIETKKEPCFQKRVCGGIKVSGRTKEFDDQRNLNEKGTMFMKERVWRNKGE